MSGDLFVIVVIGTILVLVAGAAWLTIRSLPDRFGADMGPLVPDAVEAFHPQEDA